MKLFLSLSVLSFSFALLAGPQVTVYNQKFGVVKETRTFELKSGENDLLATDMTFHIEPDSVILRDPERPEGIKVLEQNFEGDPLDQGKLLQKYEGKELKFKIYDEASKSYITKTARIIRSGYVPHQQAYSRYGSHYSYSQQAFAYGGGNTPIVEMDGSIMFNLPGTPLFDGLGKDLFLKPSLLWKLWSKESGKRDLELSYVTGGMDWDAAYNVMFPENGDTVDIIGWVNLDNQSGKTFEDAELKLMAGDVNKLNPNMNEALAYDRAVAMKSHAVGYDQNVVSKSFDEYHLYSVARKVTLRDREKKQVELLRASGVKAERQYVYDGVMLPPSFWSYDSYSRRNNRDYGTECNTKVWVMFTLANTENNKLGMPLPKGKLSLYRKDGKRNEFIGEDSIDHTPKDEKLRIKSGNAFDIVGNRKQTDYKYDNDKEYVDETFEITLSNHKKEEVTVTVVEHMYRWSNWEIRGETDIYKKRDSKTVEFRIKLKPDEVRKVSYTAHYTW